MVVEKLPEVNRPSGRVPGQVRWAVSILESPRRRNRGGDRKKRCLPSVSDTRGKYRPKGGTRRWTHPPGALLARPGGGSRQVAAWEGVAPSGPSYNPPPGF